MIKKEFQYFLDLIVDPAAIVSDDGTFLMWNNKFLDLLKCETLEGRNCYEFTHPDDISIDRDLHLQCISKERSQYVLRKRYKLEDGETIWVRLTVQYACTDGDCFSIATAQNITQELEADNIARFRGALFDALANKNFILHYQPIVALRDFHLFELKEGDVFAEEALVRWVTEDGLVSPDAFLPTLRMLGAESKLCEIVIDLAVERVGKTSRRTCINIEPLTLSLGGFSKILYGAIDRHEVDNLGLIVLEIVESDAFNEVLGAKLKVLSKTFLLSLDDWGSGYNNLGRLSDLPIHLIKLDKSVIRNKIITEQSVRLIHELGLMAVAEGVESEEQAEWLKRIRCDFAQGYLFGKPMPDRRFE